LRGARRPARGRKGVEKESLRVLPSGEMAQTRHPAALGAPLTNEHITTDFSEALIELVTPPFRESWELLQYLCDIHQFVYRHLEDEMLWSTSMPCVFYGDDGIPLAQFGASNVGRMKTIYRHGLGMRYGRTMQAISGVHFNYSFPATSGKRCRRSTSRSSRFRTTCPGNISACCAIIAASAGSSCTCSAPRPPCRRAFSGPRSGAALVGRR